VGLKYSIGSATCIFSEWPGWSRDGLVLAGKAAEGLTLAELDEEEQSLERLRRWSRAIRARDLFGAPGAANAERRLKQSTGRMSSSLSWSTSEHGGAG
jgi:hypothetical protein